MPYKVKTKLGWWDLGDKKRGRGEIGYVRQQSRLGSEELLILRHASLVASNPSARS